MRGGLWLNRQQVKWLVVLLALLPLVPTGLLVRLMVQNAAGDREAAAIELGSAYQEQLKQIADRYSASTDVPSPSELKELAHRVFGEELDIEISRPGAEAALSFAELDQPSSISYEIAEGSGTGWIVALKHIPEFADHLSEQRNETILHATGILIGISLVAGCVWFAVDRRLRIDELRTDLVTTVSHEMKTPVAASKVLLETLCHGSRDEETTREYLDLLSRENDRMAELAEQFLTFARLDNGLLTVFPVPCEIAPLVAEQISLSKPQFISKGGSISYSATGSPEVLTDPAAIKVILSNLISNSLMYGGAPPESRVESGFSGREFWISVSDNGDGISTESEGRIFREYDRGDRKLSSSSSGLGLGLAISQRFARLLGGKIEWAPDSGSQSSRFILSLPAS